MSSSSTPVATDTYLWVRPSDYKEGEESLKLPYDAVRIIGNLAEMVDNDIADGDDPPTLPATRAQLAKVIDYCVKRTVCLSVAMNEDLFYMKEDSEMGIGTTEWNDTPDDRPVSEFDKAFFKDMSGPEIMDLMCAANALDVKPMTRAGIRIISNNIRGKFTKDIADYMGLEMPSPEANAALAAEARAAGAAKKAAETKKKEEEKAADEKQENKGKDMDEDKDMPNGFVTNQGIVNGNSATIIAVINAN